MMSYKKPAFWIMIVVVVLCIAAAVGCSMNPKTEKVQSENYGITFRAIQAECEGVDYDYLYGTLNENYPYICVNWTNHTEDTLCFGNEFVIYKDDKIYEPEEEIFFDALLYTVKPGMSKSENYNLSFYKLTEGEYRLEKMFYLESAPDREYRAYLEFSVEKTYSFLGKSYIGEGIVYECGSYSSILYTDESIPKFRISDIDYHLLTTDYPESEPSLFCDFDIGELKKITLKESNFDELLTAETWDKGYSASKLRKDNLYAFEAIDVCGRLYYLLEQKNGDIYIAQGYTETNNLRWIFKMKMIENTATEELPPTTQANPGEPSWPALEDIKENYSAKQAAADGCVVFVDGSTLFAGEKIWLDFVDVAAAGKSAVVRIYQSYESGFYCVKELRYDGEKYLLQYYDWTGDTHEEFFAQQEYRYLVHSPHLVNGSESDDYLLADNEGVTAEGYFNALASSTIRPEYDIYNHCHWIYSRYR